MLSAVRAVVAIALWTVLAVYAAATVHDFYAHVDRAVYAAVDDGEASIVYALATQGHYSFPASPTLTDLSRMHGQFNYGPWYFYLAAALVWLFGFSLTLVRSIHLWVILGVAAAAACWFRGRSRAAAGALVGFGLLYFFAVVEWPMARPDSLVTAFAIVLVVSAGLGMRSGRSVYWFVAGLAAACGAFTHLIAWTLVPGAMLLFGVHVIDQRRLMRGPALALCAGLMLGAVMFYASFGFDLALQWHFLTTYRNVTATGESYAASLQRHVWTAFGFLPARVQQSVWVTMGAAWLVVIAACWRHTHRRIVLAYVLPPVLVWTLYLFSNGTYSNYHSGYAILHHTMFLWTAAALVWAACEITAHRHPAAATLLATIAMMLVLAQGVRELQWQIASPSRATQAEHRVAFSDYSEHVVGTMPAGAHAWGSVFFGMEAPERLQLIQQEDATFLIGQLPAASRASFAPDFLVWGYPEVRGDIAAGLGGKTPRLADMKKVLPDAQFRLASLVDGAPYGVTRVYARTAGAADSGRAPAVDVYDDVHRQWLDRVGPPVPVTFQPVAPVTLRIGYAAEPPANTATTTVAAELPPGRYLISVAVTPGAGSAGRLIAVTSATMVRQTITELGPRPKGDFAGYLAGDRRVFALSVHPGGTLFVSQFDTNAGAAIESVTASRILDLLNPGEREARGTALPAFTHWIPMPGIQTILRNEQLEVYGDNSVGGYQLYSPLIAATRGELVEVDVPSTVSRGQVCTGILNAKGQWLVVANEWREQLDFHADATRGFRVAFSNCQSGQAQASRFDVSPGSLIRGGLVTYVDRLNDGDAAHTEAAAVARPETVPFPDQPAIALASADVEHRAALVKGGPGAWAIDGVVSPADPWLLRSRPRFLDTETRLLVSGRVVRGGVSVGLLKDDAWMARDIVTGPGDFTVLLAPPANGRYALAVAGESDVSLTLSRIDLLPPMRPAK